MQVAPQLQGEVLLDTARQIAEAAHQGQSYGEKPYIVHPMAVSGFARGLGYSIEVQAACLLHDVIEDSTITEEQLVAESVPIYIVRGVVAVTFLPEHQDQGIDKIAKAMTDPIGHVTKFCDASCNLSGAIKNASIYGPEKTREKALRYSSFLGQLSENLPSPSDIETFIASQ